MCGLSAGCEGGSCARGTRVFEGHVCPVVPRGTRVCIWRGGTLQYPRVIGYLKGIFLRVPWVSRDFQSRYPRVPGSFASRYLRVLGYLPVDTLGYPAVLGYFCPRYPGNTRISRGYSLNSYNPYS